MTTVRQWTGREARALRCALRLSIRTFAEYLGVAVRTVSKWESQGAGTQPRPDTQAILDSALARADASVHARFELLLVEAGAAAPKPYAHQAGPHAWDYETWADDLDRAVICLSRQNFPFANNLLNRWLTRYEPSSLDSRGLYLYARTLVLFGDLQCSHGTLLGPLSAQHYYHQAGRMFCELDIPRRVAQIMLSLAVVTEMSGSLEAAARQYENLTTDERLNGRDRARARLWVGTALSKNGQNEYAGRVMTDAIQEFEELCEPDDWSVAHQKLALAYRGTGNLTRAFSYIDIARSTGAVDSPMRRVQMNTAHAHLLLSDRATRDDGFTMIDQAAHLATQHRLGHQLRSIGNIRRIYDGKPDMR